jgi:hypothetical protein
MKETVSKILERVQTGPIRAAKAIADSRVLRDALSLALVEEGQPDIAGQVFAIFVDPRNKRVSARWTPLESDSDAEAVTRFQTWVPVGYIVTVDATRDGDEEITAFSTRKLLIEEAADILNDAHLRINAIVRDELSEVYRLEFSEASGS